MSVDLSSYHQNNGTTSDGSKFNNLIDAIQTALNSVPLGQIAQSGASAGQGVYWDGSTWVATGVVRAPYRKTTAKTVNNSVAETDLLNAEITVGASAIGVSGVLRLTAEGDYLNNTGGTVAAPRFKLKLGATTLLDTNTIAAVVTASASRYGWKIVAEIANLGAANTQWASIDGAYTAGAVTGANGFTAGEGTYFANNLSGGLGMFNFKGSNTGAIDTTASQALVLSVILGSASASHEIILKRALVEIG